MPAGRSVWRCQQCGRAETRWYGRCPGCGEYDSLTEEAQPRDAERPARPHSAPVRLSQVTTGGESRISSGVPEFDRVLGGGLVRGSLVLLGGEPGIGKSTLLLQVAMSVAARGGGVVYATGEESPVQVRMRAERLGEIAEGLVLFPETDVTAVEALAESERPALLVVDSIQTAVDPDASGGAGSVVQVRAATTRLMRVAKDLGVTTVVVGHVTKEGAIAGPRVLEHMVDAVLYFEGERDHVLRVVRAVKNRFGPVSGIGMFEMDEGGLRGVEHPSSALLKDRPAAVPGSAVFPLVEGPRALLVEVQALASQTCAAQPRRLATGLDLGRVLQLLAVLDRRVGSALGSHDVYATVAGGIRAVEPACDLPLALAVASSLRDRPLPPDLAAFGEIGLAGELRPVPRTSLRVDEASRLGFARIMCPAPGASGSSGGADVIPVTTLEEALRVLD